MFSTGMRATTERSVSPTINPLSLFTRSASATFVAKALLTDKSSDAEYVTIRVSANASDGWTFCASVDASDNRARAAPAVPDKNCGDASSADEAEVSDSAGLVLPEQETNNTANNIVKTRFTI